MTAARDRACICGGGRGTHHAEIGGKEGRREEENESERVNPASESVSRLANAAVDAEVS